MQKDKQEPITCWRGLRFPEVTAGSTVVCVPWQPLQEPVHTTVLRPALCNPSSSLLAGRGVREPTDIGSLARRPGLLPGSQEGRMLTSVMDWLGQNNLLPCTETPPHPLPHPGARWLRCRNSLFLAQVTATVDIPDGRSLYDYRPQLRLVAVKSTRTRPGGATLLRSPAPK